MTIANFDRDKLSGSGMAEPHAHDFLDYIETLVTDINANAGNLGSRMIGPYADLAGIKAATAADLVDRALAFCETLGLYRYDAESSTAGDDVGVIQPTVCTGTGRFFRVSLPVFLHDHAAAATGGKLLQANSHESPDTDAAMASIHHTLEASAAGAALAATGAPGTAVKASASDHVHPFLDHDHGAGAAGGQKLLQANTHETPDTDVAMASIHHTLEAVTGGAATGVSAPGTALKASASDHVHALSDHAHAGVAGDGAKLLQANTHETPDTDAATSSLHHTIGASATQAAAGDHTHSRKFHEHFAAPKAAGTNVLTQFDDDAVGAQTGGLAQPDYPQPVQVTAGAAYDGGDVQIIGEDYAGAVLTEDITAVAGTTVVGTKVFWLLTSATNLTPGTGGVNHTVDVELGPSLGTAETGLASQDRLSAGSDGAAVIEALAASDLTEGWFTPTTAKDGAKHYDIWYSKLA